MKYSRCLLLFALTTLVGIYSRAQDATFNWMKYVQTEAPYGDAQVILDREGAPWLMVKSDQGVNYNGSGNMGFLDHEGWGFYRLDSLGNIKNRFQICHNYGRFRYEAMATDEQNNLWVAGYAQDSLTINMATGRKRLKFKGSRSVLAVFSPTGEFIRADTIGLNRSIGISDLVFDQRNRAHLLMRTEDYIYHKNNLGEHVSTAKHNLHHFLLDSTGNEISRRVFKLDEIPGGNLYNTCHISMNESGYYIAAQYHDEIIYENEVIVPYRKIESKYEPFKENHAVVMHFDPEGNFRWYKAIYGHGAQQISQITSDTTGVYFSVYYTYECNISEDNKIVHFGKGGGELGYGEMLISIAKDGRIRWTDTHAVRKYLGGFLSCTGLELDQNDQLIVAFNFKDSLVVHGKYRRYDLKWKEKYQHTSFFMIYDKKGEVLKVRKDLDYKKGNTFYADLRCIGNKFLVLGSYEPKYNGGIWDKKTHTRTPYTYSFDLSMTMPGSKNMRLPQHPTIFYKSIFLYSFNQHKVTDEPDKINTIEPEPLEPDTSMLVYVEPLLYNSLGVSNPLDTAGLTVITEPDLTFDVSPIDTASSANSSIDLNLFPNPTRRNLNIKISGVKDSFSLTFYDERGNLLLTHSAYADSSELTFEFDVSDYAGGTYLCVFVNGNGEVKTARWVKVN